MDTSTPTSTRKRKAPTLRAEDWEPYKARIIELHIEQDLSLKKVKEMLETEAGFSAEIRQYRTRISQWKLDKNIKPREMQAIVRKRQQRKLVEVDKGELHFEVRGNEVEPQKIDRWMKNHNVLPSVPYSPSLVASTPSAVYCRTISEIGSPTYTPANATASPMMPPGSIAHRTLSPQMSSPALSITSIVHSQTSGFTGQSPAPQYRHLPSHWQSSFTAPNTIESQSSSLVSLSPYRYMQAEEERLRGELSILEVTAGPHSPESLQILISLGEVLIKQGRYKSAENIARETVNDCINIYGQDDIHTLEALDFLGHALNFQGLYPEAERIFKRNLRLKKNMLGDQHISTLATQYSLAWLYLNQKRLTESEALFVPTVEAYQILLGNEHSGSLEAMRGLARTYMDQDRLKHAEELQQQLIETMTRVLGTENTQTLSTMSELAETFGTQSRFLEAEKLFLHVEEVQSRVLGEEHPDTLQTMHNRAKTARLQGRSAEAIQLMQQCHPRMEKVLGLKHPFTVNTQEFLDKWTM